MVAATALNVGAISPLPARGEAGIDGMLPEQTAALPENEEQLGAAEVSVEAVEFLDYRDGVVEYGLPLRRRCSRRRQQVDLPDLLDEEVRCGLAHSGREDLGQPEDGRHLRDFCEQRGVSRVRCHVLARSWISRAG